MLKIALSAHVKEFAASIQMLQHMVTTHRLKRCISALTSKFYVMTGHRTTKWSNCTFLLIITSAYFVLKRNAFRARSQQSNDKSCQKSCLPWQQAGSVVLATVHRCSLLRWGHHMCPFKVQLWLSPSFLRICLTFSLETECALLHVKLIFQGQTGGKRMCSSKMA